MDLDCGVANQPTQLQDGFNKWLLRTIGSSMFQMSPSVSLEEAYSVGFGPVCCHSWRRFRKSSISMPKVLTELFPECTQLELSDD